MTPLRAMSLALHYLDGVRDSVTSDAAAEAELVLEHLARSGFVLRKVESHESRGISPTSLELKGLRPDQIYAARKALGLTIKDLARKSGISPDTLVGIELGERRSWPRSVKAVVDTLARLNAGLDKAEE